ncbi:MAG: crossover junction endodeoxyribonuclease RuvC [Bacteroidota bacterium]
MKKEIIILGIDPGTIICGAGVISVFRNEEKLIHFEAIKNNPKELMHLRLKNIYDNLLKIITKFKPNEVAIETAFYSKNAQSALKIGQARGVALLAAAKFNLPITEYSPREIKKSVVGSGSASKEQMQFMTMSILKIKNKPKHFDESDALGIAICHSHRILNSKNKFASWKKFLELHPERIKIIK